MFTRLVSSIANSYIVSFLRDFLSGYVDNVDPAQLKASLDKGEVSLSALRLKRDIFDFLSIPVTVVIGYVGVLSIKIPWRSLASQPIVVTIDDVIIVLRAMATSEWDEQREIQLKEEYKTRALEVFDFLHLSAQDDKKPKSLVWRIASSLFANLQVEEASLSSCHTNFTPNSTRASPAAATPNVSCKLADVRRFGIYLEAWPADRAAASSSSSSSWCPELTHNLSDEEHRNRAVECLQRAGRSESYALQPVDGELRIMTTKVPTRTGPNECFSPHDGEWIPKGMGNNCSDDRRVTSYLPAVYVGFVFPEAEFRFSNEQLMDLSKLIYYHMYLYGNFYYAIYYNDKDLQASIEEKEEYMEAWARKCSILVDRNGVTNKELSGLELKLRDFEAQYHLDYIMAVRREAVMKLRKPGRSAVESEALRSGIVSSIIQAISPRKSRPSIEVTSTTSRAVAGERAVEELQEMLGESIFEDDEDQTQATVDGWTVDFSLELDLSRCRVTYRLDQEGQDICSLECGRLRLLSDTMADYSWSVSLGLVQPRLRMVFNEGLASNRTGDEKNPVDFETVLEVEGGEPGEGSDLFMRVGMAQSKREDMPDVTVRGFSCGQIRLVVIPEILVTLAVEIRSRLDVGGPMQAILQSASEKIQRMLKEGLELAKDIARGNYEHRSVDLQLDLGAPVLVLIPRDPRAECSDAILLEVGGVSLRSEIRDKVNSTQGISVEDAFDLYDVVAVGNSAWYLPSCCWAPSQEDVGAQEIWKRSGFKVHARVCHLPRERLLPNAVMLIELSQLKINLTEKCLELVIAILLSAVHELEKVDEMVGLREFEVAVPPTQ
ncbi:Vacuolar protein sorting-associated protein 13B [Perkinsus olseni]|uniref:Vacuolar protein sorting-associated protein 13B n=2 Tax=Perkinsus olseni TaxID=32597 RepID=A0A7J6NQF7_PEROL|nr:Vacuolar protein sorting-associated protein 13B [Perkinsus olseni]